MNLLVGYKKCTTCKGIEKLLQEKAIEYDYREIDKENPTASELKEWHEKSGLPITKFFNNSGILYREQGLSEKRKSMTEEEQYEVLATNGMLVKRPILFLKDEIFVGPQVKKHLESL